MSHQSMRLDVGLRRTAIGKTTISDIDPINGAVHYRGRSALTLAGKHRFVDVLHLLLEKHLPNERQASALAAEICTAASSAAFDRAALDRASHLEPMAFLQAAIRAPQLFKINGRHNCESPVSIIAESTAAIIHFERTRKGRGHYEYDKSRSLPENYLLGLTESEANHQALTCIEQAFILIAEHGANASTFAARVTASAGSCLRAALAAGACCFEGALHGGAVEHTYKMIRSIGTPDRVREVLNQRRTEGLPIFGFGHRVYRAYDPRARRFKEMCLLLRYRDRDRTIDIIEALEAEMARYRRRGVWPNAELFGGTLYALLGIPPDLFCVTHALSRMAGWATHVAEQNRSGVIIRPALQYVGHRLDGAPL